MKQLTYQDYGLLVDRSPVHFRDISTDTNGHFPKLVITKHPPFNYRGVECSGTGALIILDNTVYKIKGCNFEADMERRDGEKFIRHYANFPYGGHLLRQSRHELTATQQIKERLESEGFPYPYTPFLVDTYGQANLIDSHRERKKIDLGMLVMKIQGDTRLPEIYLQPEIHAGAVEEVGHLFGLAVGAQLKVTRDYSWKGNAHLLNIVVFERDEPELSEKSTHVAMVDHEDTIPVRWPIVSNLYSLYQTREVLLYAPLCGTHLSNTKKFRGRTSYAPSSRFFKRFRQGVWSGWIKPERRKDISSELVHQAFDLSA